MKDYYNLIVDLSMQQLLVDDYADKIKIRKHDRAMNKILKLQEEMMDIECDDVILKLLEHSEERVKLEGVVCCKRKRIYLDKAKEVLEDVINNPKDPTMQYAAEKLFEQIQGL